PVRVPPRAPRRRRWGLGRIPGEPFGDVVVVELLRPEQTGPRLPQHRALFWGRCRRSDYRVEPVRLADALVERTVESHVERRCRVLAVRTQPEPQHGFRSPVELDPVPGGRLRAALVRVHGGLVTLNHA